MSLLSKLYPYQTEAVNSLQNANKGIVVLPTGTGKTFCQAATIIKDIHQYPNQFRLYVINAPRILLTYQLFTEVYQSLLSENIDARYMFCHSGNITTGSLNDYELIRKQYNEEFNQDIKFSQILSSTNPFELGQMMKDCQSHSMPLIIFSTYNSFEVIENARFNNIKNHQINILFNDECHYLTREQFHENIFSCLSTEKLYNFTATPSFSDSDNGKGMNNETKFGQILYSMTPKQAIDLGRMVRPRLHFAVADRIYNDDDFNKSLPKIIYETFKQHERVLNSENNPKILVSVDGSNDMIRFMKSDYYKKIRNENVDVFAISSIDLIGNQINGNKTSRQDFLKELKKAGLDQSKKLLVLHYDILTEGIDVSGFTALMPLRDLNKNKFLQAYGRIARLHPTDRFNIDNNIITPNDIKQMIKPYAYIIVPCISISNNDTRSHFEKLIKELRSDNFEIGDNDVIVSSMINGIPEFKDLEQINLEQSNYHGFGHIVKKIDMELEDESVAKLTKLTLLNKILNE